MLSKIALVVIVIIGALFLLSVFGPVKSQKKFWIFIRRTREIMDWIVFGMFVLYAIAAVVFIIVMVIKGALGK